MYECVHASPCTSLNLDIPLKLADNYCTYIDGPRPCEYHTQSGPAIRMSEMAMHHEQQANEPDLAHLRITNA